MNKKKMLFIEVKMEGNREQRRNEKKGKEKAMESPGGVEVVGIMENGTPAECGLNETWYRRKDLFIPPEIAFWSTNRARHNSIVCHYT